MKYLMHAPKIQIYPLAMAKIINHSASNPNKEIAGFLIGYFKDKYTIITDSAIVGQKGTAVHVIIDDMELARIAEGLEMRGTGEIIVGWYHSHPNMGAHFFSMTDISTQRRYQMFSPLSVGFVVDPANFIRSEDPTKIDLKCWKILNQRAIQLDYEIITDSRACLKNLLVHVKQGFMTSSDLKKMAYTDFKDKKLIKKSKEDLILKISTQTMIISTLLVFMLLFLSLI